ncbi:protein VASCULAR ASSOCIATED DEATH 1, chloroplastic isoform X1 [Beta vulgaris subsp. vulgaris]|uniref:protein VASCULAR ASSOCIATED DEATH 1, chloroplastic isoform X1 n=1 Tax=Beta vulgaris subsp. vulgaris TaxID=3555 RepID=UPI0020366EB5|nr:protein VASCULAR ASSOCIATED DEATH 1, chloroplastic isoform X1 [Beta vulgaris subsp. vulgaris]XP_010692055.2 protein VASCULAR ASSOCIATED DEATH 1, chloroplastic isoform X1 [Beta vulgaris subsp. vulgaris]XP_010692056.2 protein VASCULAR ASSOCIATED DEATH 1, chloroplastic isoform X1 [Beta vulgaris subsp. vulgaris]
MAAAMAGPARIAPSSQTMVSSPAFSPPRQSSEVSSNSSEQPDSISRALSFSRNGDSQSADLLKSEEYRQLFRLPSEEVLLQDFNCALQENILLQGHMYLFEHYICFYSNIFGFETKKIIPLQDVTAVRRAKTAGIFPNAIEIEATGKKHFFASFLSRDEAFKLIDDGWSNYANGPKVMLDQQDSKSERISQSNAQTPAETANNSDSSVSECDSDERNLEVSTAEEIKLPPDHVHDNAMSTVQETPHVLEEKQDDAEPSTSSRSINWNLETQEAPEIPKCYTKVAESKFPIDVEQFFNLFISDDAVGFVKSFHNKCGDKDLRCTSWSPHDRFGYTRVKTFQHPIKIYFGAKCGGCKETQNFQVYKCRHLVIKTSQEVSDVPYADYFIVEGRWDVQKDNDQSEGCILQVYMNVAFSKKTMWKGKIEQSTLEECRDVFANWIQLAHEMLKQNIEKTEEDALLNTLQDGQVDQRVSEQPAKNMERSAEPQRTNDTVANSWGTPEQIGNNIRGNLLPATTTVMSTLRAIAVKFCTSLRSQGNLQLFLVFAFLIILLLMQLSIVVLLSRPQPVHLIPQADYMSSVGLGAGNRAAEAMAWMEKRVHLLKDEMLVVEAQLERMRHEHIMLKSQLKDLEGLYKQQR